MKRLNVESSSFDLNITYRWRSAVAFFLLFFCLFWDGFLVTWYAMGFKTMGEIRGENLMFFVFPLIHVSIGVWLTYYTICLFLNKTHINVDQQWVTVRSGPLPWPRSNKEIAVSEIKQLYVREHEGGKGSKYYTLEALISSGDSLRLIEKINAPTTELLELEKVIEDFVGIIDQPVEEEYPRKSTRSQVLPEGGKRMVRRPEYSPGYSARNGVEIAKVGSFIKYEGRTFEVSHESIFQWNNGNTDRMLQLADIDGTQVLLYIKQDKGLFSTYLEVRFSQAQETALDFRRPPTPRELNYDRVTFELDEQAVGKEYQSHITEQGIAATQWLYRSTRADEYLRIVDHQGMTTTYFGQSEIAGAFDVI